MMQSKKTEWVKKPEAKEYDLKDLLTRGMSSEEYRALYFCDPVPPTEEEQKEQQEVMEERKKYRRECSLRERQIMMKKFRTKE